MITKLILYEEQNKGGTHIEFYNLNYVGQGRRSVCFEAEHTGIICIIKKLKCPTELNKAAFRRAFEINRELMFNSGNSVSQLYGYFYDDKNCPYIVAGKIVGKTLQETQFFDLHTLFEVFIRLSKAIHQVHEAGYLCIDLSPSNILVLPDNAGLFGTILFDFDSMVEFEAVRQIDGVASTVVFASPELVRKEFASLCRQSDYYSLANLLYNEIYGYFPIPDLCVPNQEAKPEYQNRLESSVIIRDTLKEFWKKTLTLYPEDRYSDFDSLLRVLCRLCDLSHSNLQRNVRSNFSPDPGKNYVRTSQLDDLKKFFLSRKDTYAVGVIHGESGCGKSTLAHALAKELEQHYDCVEWCSYDRRGFKGILEQITLVDPGKSAEEKESALKMNNQRILIVIDNFDEDMSKQALTPWGNCHIVITSRYGVESFAGLAQSETCIDVPLGSSPELGWAVFQNVYHSLSGKKLSDEQRQEVDILLEKVGYHTYASDLIARALAKDFSPSAIEYIWEEKVTSRKDIQVGHKSLEATVEEHISALFADQIRKLMRGKRKIETEILFLLSKDRIWNREWLCILVGDNPDCGRKQAKEIVDRMVFRNLLKDEGERFFGTYKGKAISVHPLVQMAIQRIFANKRTWDEEEHIFRALYNLYSRYQDSVRTGALAPSAWPEGFRQEVAEKTIGKLGELEALGSEKNTWKHYISLLYWVNQMELSLEIKQLLCLDFEETYYAYLITDDETIFFAYAGERMYPLMVLQSVYPKEELPDLDEQNISTICGSVSICAIFCGRFEQQELIIPSEICENPVYEVMRVFGHLKRVCFPDGFLSIGSAAFIGNIPIEEVVLPDSLMVIWDYAFFGTFIQELYVPSSVQLISDSAFADCKYLERVTIAADNIRIEVGAFMNCTELREVVIQGENVSVEDGAFWGCSNLNIVASKEWKEKNRHLLATLPAYEPFDDQEAHIILPMRKAYIKELRRDYDYTLTELRGVWGDIIDEEEEAYLNTIPKTQEGMTELLAYLQKYPDCFYGWEMLLSDDTFGQLMPNEQRAELVNRLKKIYDLEFLQSVLPTVFESAYTEANIDEEDLLIGELCDELWDESCEPEEENCKDEENSIDTLLNWTSSDGKQCDEVIDEETVRQSIRDILNDLGID